MAKEFADLGVEVPTDVIEVDDPIFEIWEENVDSLNAFFAVETQWHVLAIASPVGGAVIRTGLDYTAVDIVLRRRQLGDAVFEDILVMEQAALAAWTEAR